MADEWVRSAGEAEALLRVIAGLGGVGAGLRRGGLPPPSWATNSVVEAGGVTHQRVSPLRPLVLAQRLDVGTAFAVATEVSVSVFDRPGQYRWVRLPPRIQVESGSYPVEQARMLVRAIEGLISAVG
jgi:hypothetical protein